MRQIPALRHLATLWMAALPLLAGAAGMADSIAVEDAHVRQMPAAAPNSAAFLTLINTSTTPIRVTGVGSPVAATVELHDHIQDGEILRMRRIDGIDIPAGARVALAPGGKHVMLIGLKQPLQAGTTVDFRLQFADGSSAAFSAPVTPIRPATPTARH
ncbi:copper chaperone PCu(A)C [Denitromonas iodatirespirans]|uniref:Copper chaperone PCu(A)C n=1 Tax=Denitromonas iodatirespirans TaxID=2795389 RepID=A0A944DDL2_DENI1|nr:copper chaperone PCu(A)C [Denitromonas iodatirespirans]MBT0963111.1 copper chaperone PCu(A)C [Denitromonas iodatirespirans]